MNVHISSGSTSTLTPIGTGRQSRRRDDGKFSGSANADSDASPAAVAPVHDWYPPLKNAVEFALALVLLVAAAPVILVAALVMRLVSPGPAFYRQTRLGRNGRPFRICKIRTMVHNAEARTGPVWAQDNDPRITRFGRFLRSTHIDEFPQLVHVLSGHMSLIGPRPERPEFVQHLQWQVPRYLDRLNVKPGVTGLAQMLLPPDSDVDDVRRKVRCDLYYVRYVSPWLDAKIAVQTVWLLVVTLAGVLLSPFRLPTSETVFRKVADVTE